MAQYYAVEDPVFQPAMRNILSITQGLQTLITTTFDGINPGDHDYVTGMVVRLRIPSGFGMVRANNLSGPITVVNATQFTLPIDTTDFDPFVIPPFIPGFKGGTPAQVIPIGANPIRAVQSSDDIAIRNVLPYP